MAPSFSTSPGSRGDAPRATPLDLFAGGVLGEWAVRSTPAALVNQVVCRDDALAAVADAHGHTVFDNDPHGPAFVPGPAALSVHYPRILAARLVAAYDHAIWNLHSGLLPWGRGMCPEFWALWERTPAGATLHELTAGLHEGPIVEQRRVAVFEGDTGGQVHARVQVTERELCECWLPRLAAGVRPRTTPQAPGGSYHSLAEFEFMRDEGRYEVPLAEGERLARCLTLPGPDDPAADS